MFTSHFTVFKFLKNGSKVVEVSKEVVYAVLFWYKSGDS